MDFLQTVGILDIVFIGILVISTLIGLIRGAIREILSLVGLGAAIYLAFKFSDMVSKNYVSKFFEQERISYILSFVLIIIATIFIIALINLFISQLLKASGLSFVNRFFGFLFGIFRGGVICSILVLVIGFVPGVTKEKWWTESALAPFFKQIVKQSFDYMPDNVSDYFESAKDNINKVTGVKPTNTTETTVKSVRPSSSGSLTPEQSENVARILQSIESSNKDTKKSGIQLESAEPSEEENAPSPLVLESLDN